MHMELREYLDIFRKQASFFWFVVLLCLAVAFVWQRNQSVNFQATLLLNIGRAGVQTTQDYTFDGFYRLQADERFADTVVRWLGSPRVVEDIYADTRLNAENLSTRDLKGVFKAGRLSSQMIEVVYGGSNEKTLGDISRSVTTILNRYTDSLNKENSDPTRFIVIGSDPVIRDARVGLLLALVVGLVTGVFIGFWGVLLKHYFSGENKNRSFRSQQ